jgi:thymidylate synthase ThyX
MAADGSTSLGSALITATNILTSHTTHSPTLHTLELTIPKFLIGQLNTHRVFSRNSGSSRAVPTWQILDQVWHQPYLPRRVGRYSTGMQPSEELTGHELEGVHRRILDASDAAVKHAVHVLLNPADYKDFTSRIDFDNPDFELLRDYSPVAAKETVNRIVEPYMMTKVVLSGTDWDNFLNLRSHTDSQYEMQDLAVAVQEALRNPLKEQTLSADEWHLPYIDSTFGSNENILYSASACAKVSYLREGTAMDLERALSLLQAGHLSPFEHTAKPMIYSHPPRGNFTGWDQARHMLSLTRDGSVVRG